MVLVGDHRYEGCYRDDIRNRDFIQSTKWVDTVEMTRERCASHCFVDLGYPYMGLQVSFISIHGPTGCSISIHGPTGCSISRHGLTG